MYTFLLIISYIAALQIFTNGYIVDPGPVVKATIGQIWPLPKKQSIDNHFSVLRLSDFRFQILNNTCDILDKAINRYLKIIEDKTKLRSSSHRRDQQQIEDASWRNDDIFDGFLQVVKLNLKAPCERLPYLGMDEAYTYTQKNTMSELESNSVWGILRGLESFVQMIVPADNNGALRINSTVISDEPRFTHRGLLLDTSRHFVTLPIIYKILDGMEMNKLNVFHWHIVDDHSFPYVSTVYPDLSEKGAYSESAIYNQQDVQNVIEYARLRGIRVMPEFDTPGHTRSWGVGYPEILTECGGPYKGKLGPVDPTKSYTYEFMEKLFTEVAHVFPDQYIHLGGDEVEFECWRSSNAINDYMQKNNITRYEKLEDLYIQRLVNIIDNLNVSSIVWQEVYLNGVNVPKETVIHIWTGNRYLLLGEITFKGHPALLSSCWYLDHLVTGGDWEKYYNCDPHDFSGTDAQKRLVMGGEACMWAESVDDDNILQRIYPRVSATAEKLWSSENAASVSTAKGRLEEHTCRMKTRGIPAQPPNGPGYCYY